MNLQLKMKNIDETEVPINIRVPVYATVFDSWNEGEVLIHLNDNNENVKNFRYIKKGSIRTISDSSHFKDREIKVHNETPQYLLQNEELRFYSQAEPTASIHGFV